MYKAAEQEAGEMYAKDVLPRVDTVLTILIGKVCNVPSVVANFRLVQKFKTKIWRLNQALAKAKPKEGLMVNIQPGNLRFITMGNSSF